MSTVKQTEGWTQQALADRADVTLKYLQRVEAGEENLMLESLVRLSNLLGVSVKDLLAPAPFSAPCPWSSPAALLSRRPGGRLAGVPGPVSTG